MAFLLLLAMAAVVSAAVFCAPAVMVTAWLGGRIARSRRGKGSAKGEGGQGVSVDSGGAA